MTRTIASWIDQEGLFLDTCTGGELITACKVGWILPDRVARE
ncbi:diaminopimelate decarboxylase [Cutibacterium acnes JCM 18918]|nr:diaminopimelate decarboxylase [Cutibacterium acnes JCM 18918]